MMDVPQIIVLSGGVSEERKVSLQSGQSAAQALKKHFTVGLIDLKQTILPREINSAQHIVFPALHGTFGEDGSIQQLMDRAHVHYAGSDACASRLCFNKEETKKKLAQHDINVPRGIMFKTKQPPSVEKVIRLLGEQLIIKPACQGSSIGLHRIHSRQDLESVLHTIDTDTCEVWLIENYLNGQEFSVGLLEGKSLGVVEVIPEGGIYDYYHKYTAEKTQYRFPAKVGKAMEHKIRILAEQAFKRCGCRDFARIDFILTTEGHLFILEVNTLPGLTPTSLFPKSAACEGYTFEALVLQMVQPAIKRFQAKMSS